MVKTTGKKEYPHSGHRQRLIEKIETFALCDHELLEALLFNAVPRQNTNELAHRLLSTFGGLEEILSTPIEQLESVDGVGRSIAAYLRVIGIIYQRVYDKNKSEKLPKKFNFKTFVPYVKRAYENMSVEVLDVYVLDDTGEIITKTRFSSAETGKVEIYTQQLMRVFFQYNPAGIVLVHNHPRGTGTPSPKDDYMTAHCQKVCADNGIVFCDHIICGQQGVYSYYLQERLDALGDAYDEKYEKWMKGVLADATP